VLFFPTKYFPCCLTYCHSPSTIVHLQTYLNGCVASQRITPKYFPYCPHLLSFTLHSSGHRTSPIIPKRLCHLTKNDTKIFSLSVHPSTIYSSHISKHTYGCVYRQRMTRWCGFNHRNTKHRSSFEDMAESHFLVFLVTCGQKRWN
jgi:hypothetical protein